MSSAKSSSGQTGSLSDWFHFASLKPQCSLEQLKSRSAGKGSYDSEEAKSFVDDEQFRYSLEHVVVGQGELRVVQKVYPPSDSAYTVGWVVEDIITHCMICGGEFGVFNWKHHCRCSISATIFAESIDIKPFLFMFWQYKHDTGHVDTSYVRRAVRLASRFLSALTQSLRAKYAPTALV